MGRDSVCSLWMISFKILKGLMLPIDAPFEGYRDVGCLPIPRVVKQEGLLKTLLTSARIGFLSVVIFNTYLTQ